MVNLFRLNTGADTAKLLHVSTNAQHEPNVHTHGSDVGTRLAADPEDSQMALCVILDQLRLVNGTNAQLTLDSTDQRRTLWETST